MVEKSMLWDTGVVATDGALPYDQSEWSLLMMEMFTRDPDEGVCHTDGTAAVDQELQPGGGAAQATVGTGRAICGGFPYRNTALVTFAVDLPAANTRYDKIFLKADWTTKLVRLVLEKNPSEGVDDLVTHHVIGDHWDIPIATVEIHTDGTTWVTDDRQFCSASLSVKGDTIELGSITHANIANRSGRQLWPVQPTSPSDAMIGSTGWIMQDGKDRSFVANIAVPDDYAAGDFTLSVIGYATADGDYWIDLVANSGRINQPYNEDTAQFAGTVTTLVANQLTAVAVTTCNLYALEGYINAVATRYGTAPGDGTGSFVIMGIRIQYTRTA